MLTVAMIPLERMTTLLKHLCALVLQLRGKNKNTVHFTHSLNVEYRSAATQGFNVWSGPHFD